MHKSYALRPEIVTRNLVMNVLQLETLLQDSNSKPLNEVILAILRKITKIVLNLLQLFQYSPKPFFFLSNSILNLL